MKNKIIAMITEYQDAIAKHFEAEQPIGNDPEHMENFMENLKKEIEAAFAQG